MGARGEDLNLSAVDEETLEGLEIPGTVQPDLYLHLSGNAVGVGDTPGLDEPLLFHAVPPYDILQYILPYSACINKKKVLFRADPDADVPELREASFGLAVYALGNGPALGEGDACVGLYFDLGVCSAAEFPRFQALYGQHSRL